VSKTQGIEIRHARSCASRSGGRCGCTKTYQASVWSKRENKRIRKTFSTLAGAKAWRSDAYGAVRRGQMRSPVTVTLREEAEDWLRNAAAGLIRKRGGGVYKPSVLRSYETSLRLRVLPKLGAARLSEIQSVDVQDFVGEMEAQGLDPSTIRNTVMPLRAIYRRAASPTRQRVAVNPTMGIELPSVEGRRDKIVAPKTAAAMLAALPEGDRALWATALYAGLRRGELMALRIEDIDFGTGVIRVERSWDMQAGPVEPKSRAGRRTVPIAAVLREQLIAHRLRLGRSDGLVFGRTAERPFEPGSVAARARKAWAEFDQGGSHRDAARRSAYVRQPDDRGRRERQGTVHVHGALQHHGDP